MPDEDQLPLHEQPTLRDIPPVQVRPAWPPPPRQLRRQALPPATTILLSVLALVLILGGLGFIIYSTTTQYRSTLHAYAAVQAQSTISARNTALAKTQVVMQATNQALATVQVNIYATATAQTGVTATASAASGLGTATATALQDMLNSATTGTPDLDDPLSDNSGNNAWDEGVTGNSNTGCFFTGGDYHARAPSPHTLQPCFADATNFSNFVYKVTMTIDSGDQGGILFRANKSRGQYYLFRVGTDGSYTLELYTNNNSETFLSTGISSAVSTGFGQQNDIALIANKNTLYLFINQQFVTGASDNTSTSGQIGVAAVDYSTATEVEFSNAQVWKL